MIKRLGYGAMVSPRLSTCEPVAAVGGYSRVSCGRLFFSEAGKHRPANFYAFRDLTSAQIIWGDGNIVINHNPGGRTDPADNSGRPQIVDRAEIKLVGVLDRTFGYIQAAMSVSGNYNDQRPGVRMVGPLSTQATTRRDVYSSVAGNAGNLFAATGASGYGGPSQMTDTGFVIFGLEIIETSQQARSFHDAGNNDPRLAFDTATTFAGPFDFRIISDNGVNGFANSVSFGNIAAMKRRRIRLQGLPGAGSVRISYNGVVQQHGATPVPYLNATAGVIEYDARPGVVFPAIMRYEIFSLAALAGVLISDLTVPVSYGGDVISNV